VTAPPSRPFCAETARDLGEPLAATASHIDHWLLVEYTGYWPYEPLDAAVFSGPLREHLAAQLAALRRARLLLIKPPGRRRGGAPSVFFGRTTEEGGRFLSIDVASYDDLLHLDLTDPAGEPMEHPLLLVCTHGIRDRCCARYGQALLRELAREADPEWVWQATHVGGDRFAGNLVVLPEGLYYGRVGRAEVAPILASHVTGHIELSRYRGRSCYSFAVQAAEGHVRRATGLTAIADLRLLSARRNAHDRFTVELLAAPAATVHELEVGVEFGEPALLTCTSHEPQRPRHHVVKAHRERQAD